MKVKATEVGYYELQIKQVGQVFELKDPKDFSGLWMQAVNKTDQKKYPVKDKQHFKDQLDAATSGMDVPADKVEAHPDEVEPAHEHGDDEEPVI